MPLNGKGSPWPASASPPFKALSQRLPPEAAIYNPVDVIGHATAEQYRAALELVLADPGVDLGVALSAPHPVLRYAELARIVAEAKERFGKPIAVSFMAGELGEEAEEILRQAGIPSFFDPARAVRALSALVKYAEVRERRRSPPPRFPRIWKKPGRSWKAPRKKAGSAWA